MNTLVFDFLNPLFICAYIVSHKYAMLKFGGCENSTTNFVFEIEHRWLKEENLLFSAMPKHSMNKTIAGSFALRAIDNAKRKPFFDLWKDFRERQLFSYLTLN